MVSNQTELKSIDIMSAGKVTAILMGILGGIFGILYGLFFIGMGIISAATSGSAETTTFIIMGASFIIFSIPGYALIGFLMGLLYAWAYNLIARKWGGLKFELN